VQIFFMQNRKCTQTPVDPVFTDATDMQAIDGGINIYLHATMYICDPEDACLNLLWLWARERQTSLTPYIHPPKPNDQVKRWHDAQDSLEDR
jgi:hypothetical protein